MPKAEWLSFAPHAVATIFVVLVALSDWRARRIPTASVGPAIVLGLALHAARGWNGLEFSLKGLGLGFALLILPYVFGGMKAGDVKFLAAIGALVGATDVFRALLMTVCSSGPMQPSDGLWHSLRSMPGRCSQRTRGGSTR